VPRDAVRLLHARHDRGEPAPDEAGIREALAGNLCMCTGYVNIVRAVAQAAVRLAVPAP